MSEPKRKLSPASRGLLLALGIALAYALAARLGFVLRFPPATTSVLWPPNALLTAALLLTPRERWWILLAAVFPAHVLVEVHAGLPASLVLGLYVTNCSEALLGAALLHRWSDAPTRIDSLRRVTAFLAAAVIVAPLATSFADAAVVHWLRDEEFWQVFARRSLSNALSALTIVPSTVAIVTQGPRWLRTSSPRRRLEAALLAGGLLAAGMIVFLGQRDEGVLLPGAPYTSLTFLIPFLMGAALRFGPGAASLGLLATSLMAVRAAVLGWRPFAPLTPEEGVVALQVFVVVVGGPLLFLSALVEERRQAGRRPGRTAAIRGAAVAALRPVRAPVEPGDRPRLRVEPAAARPVLRGGPGGPAPLHARRRPARRLRLVGTRGLRSSRRPRAGGHPVGLRASAPRRSRGHLGRSTAFHPRRTASGTFCNDTACAPSWCSPWWPASRCSEPWGSSPRRRREPGRRRTSSAAG